LLAFHALYHKVYDRNGFGIWILMNAYISEFLTVIFRLIFARPPNQYHLYLCSVDSSLCWTYRFPWYPPNTSDVQVSSSAMFYTKRLAGSLAYVSGLGVGSSEPTFLQVTRIVT
jgi:hypothetical protein